MGKPKIFTEEQEKYILENYCTKSNAEIANILGFKREQINTWLIHHGIKRNGAGGYYNQIFTKEDIQFIKENYLSMTYAEIGDNLGFTESQIQGKIRKLKLCKKNRIANERYFECIDNPLKSYLLGFIYADGWVVFNENRGNYEFGMMLQATDKYVLDKINFELGNNNLISYNPPRNLIIEGKPICSGEAYTLRVFSKRIVMDLISHGIETNKSNKDTYPTVSDDLFFDFLRGYIDGDGCFYKNNNKTYMHITCSSIEPLKFIKQKLQQFGICTKIYTENNKKHRLMCVNTNEMSKLVNRLYYEEGSFCLSRKYEKIKHFLGLSA